MLGIILIYFLGKYFYELAQDYYKHRWLFAILGVLSYYFGAIVIGGLLLGFGLEFFGESSIDSYSDIEISLMVIPFGIACAYLFYFLLKRQWKKEVLVAKDSIDDIGKTDHDIKNIN